MNHSKVSSLAQNQQPIWVDQIAHPNSPVYNIGGRLEIYGEIDRQLLQKALQQLVVESDALRLQIHQVNGSPQQFVKDYIDCELPLLDFSAKTDSERAADNWLQNAFRKAFPMGRETVYWQFALIKINSRQYALLTKYHHLIADGWSTKIVIDRLAELYNALLNREQFLSTVSTGYLDYVEHECLYLSSPAYQRDKNFWLNYMQKLPEPLIPQKFPVAAQGQHPNAHIHRMNIDRRFYNELTRRAGAHRATIYHLLLAGICLYFARIQQQSCFTVGIPVLNRSGARFKNVVGMFANLSPLIVDLDMTISSSQLLNHFCRAVRQIHKHQRYPLSAVSQQLNLSKNKRERLFDLVVSYERQDYSARFGEAKVKAKQLFSGVAQFPLAVTVCEFNDDDVEIIFEGAETCFNVREQRY